MEHIGTALSQVHQAIKIPALSLKQVLESYSHIELSEEELDEAILSAKRKKEILLEQQKIKDREAENRKLFIETAWSMKQTASYAEYRATQIFDKKFELDKNNQGVYFLLCAYFSRHSEFFSIAAVLEIENPSLEKGILLAGSFGTGKTWMMRLFSRNQRKVFTVQNAKAIADIFEATGEESIQQFVTCPSLPANDVENFCHARMGICIDDLGTEGIKMHYGNRKNVIGDLIELRYETGNTGTVFHATTNLNSEQLKEFYGGRVTSRLR